MKEYRFLYKCRVCGRIDDSEGCSFPNDPQVAGTLTYATMGIKGENVPVMTSVHKCPGGDWGIVDLIGTRSVE